MVWLNFKILAFIYKNDDNERQKEMCSSCGQALWNNEFRLHCKGEGHFRRQKGRPFRDAGAFLRRHPNASGLIIIALDEAVKAMPLLMGLDKEYAGEMLLHSEVSRERVEEVFRKFVGTIEQLPPKRSAVARKPRKRTIHSLEIIGMEGRIISFRVLCEAGTYIRKLCHDIGEALGCGAHMKKLRRTAIADIRVSEAATLEEIERSERPERYLTRLESILKRVEKGRALVRESALDKVRHGSPLDSDDLKECAVPEEPGTSIPIYDEKGRIIAIGRFMKNPKENRRKVLRIDRVFSF